MKSLKYWAVAALALSACGGSTGTSTDASTSFTVGGTVSGLSGTVVLQDNGGDDLSQSADGTFTFATPVAQGSQYHVTVKTQPASQTCTVSNGGPATMGSANVAGVVVTCTTNTAPTFTVGGTLSGLYGTVVLQDNGADDLSLTTSLAGNANGSFTFATPVAQGDGYAVTVKTQPSYQTCSVSSGTSSGGSANVTSVEVVCKGFGAPCATAADCTTDYPVCWSFPNGAPFPVMGCTKSCSNAGVADPTMCPVGSQGRKCNQQLVCRY
jgi:hypothetical protein